MAAKNSTPTNTAPLTDAEKQTAQVNEARQAQLAAEEDARRASLTDEQREAEDAKAKADKAESEMVQAQANAARDATAEATPATEVKGVSAAVDEKLDIGAHTVQTFANVPENPQLAPGLDRESEGKVKLVLNDSDHPDPMYPKVTFVHEAMVGDYVRAGWRRPVAE